MLKNLVSSLTFTISSTIGALIIYFLLKLYFTNHPNYVPCDQMVTRWYVIIRILIVLVSWWFINEVLINIIPWHLIENDGTSEAILQYCYELDNEIKLHPEMKLGEIIWMKFCKDYPNPHMRLSYTQHLADPSQTNANIPRFYEMYFTKRTLRQFYKTDFGIKIKKLYKS